MPSKKLTNDDLKEIAGASASAKESEADFKEEQKEEVLVDGKKPRKKRKIKNKENYVDPKIFTAQIIKFYDDGDLNEELGTSIINIATRLGFAPNFINYTYKEEMIGDAIEKMFKALWNKKFDPDKGYNPFSYYTRIAYNAFCNRIKKEKRSREAIIGYQTEVYETLIHTGNMPDDQAEDNTGDDGYDN